jgi:hypothetical protein
MPLPSGVDFDLQGLLSMVVRFQDDVNVAVVW